MKTVDAPKNIAVVVIDEVFPHIGMAIMPVDIPVNLELGERFIFNAPLWKLDNKPAEVFFRDENHIVFKFIEESE